MTNNYWKRYPKRTDYHKGIEEGTNMLFDVHRRIVVTVVWDQKSGKGGYVSFGKYKITHAWIAETRAKAISFPDYPFVRTKKDKTVVDHIVMSHCSHAWDFWNYHAVCTKCTQWIHGDYREQVIAEEGEEAVKMNDDYIIANYGEAGLALRRGRVGIKECAIIGCHQLNLMIIVSDAYKQFPTEITIN